MIQQNSSQNRVKSNRSWLICRCRNLFKASALLALVLFSSCSKEDPVNNSGSVVFWNGESVAQYIVSNGATHLYYYLDGKEIAIKDAKSYWKQIPECSNDQAVTATKSLGSGNSKTFTYTVKDQTGRIYFDGSVEVEANGCLHVELTR